MRRVVVGIKEGDKKKHKTEPSLTDGSLFASGTLEGGVIL
jgi:hypothetical protein